MQKATKLSRYKLFYERVSIQKATIRTVKNRPSRSGRLLPTPKNILDNIEV
jgi:hypothetical protein